MKALLGTAARAKMDKSVEKSVEDDINESIVSIRLENDQLKKDNGYLVDLLKKTKEYNNLAKFIEDSGGIAARFAGLSNPWQNN